MRLAQGGLAQVVDLISGVPSHPPDGARIRVDRLRLQAFELQVRLVQFVVLVKIDGCDTGHLFHLAVTSPSS
ncbi:MAG: hypothetical protein IAE88_12840 [Rhodobacteraceae bacterium]|nr:hypothetical protein [Paracoccaceae bacterium]